MTQPISPPRVKTGVEGLDLILDGGLPRGCLYLIEGNPGSGKTTLALQFLLTGCAQGEKALLISLSETAAEMHSFAASHGWSLQGLEILDLSDMTKVIGDQGRQSVFHSSEVELVDAINLIRQAITDLGPSRIVIDSLSEFRHLAGDNAVYRLNMDALKPQLVAQGCTVVLVDTLAAPDSFALHTMAHGVISLGYTAPEVGPFRRQLCVQKIRGVKFREGMHDFEVLTGKVAVYPRLVPAKTPPRRTFTQLSSGNADLDGLLGGGLDISTSTLVLGPAGSGKSTILAQFSDAALKRNEKVVVFLFDEHLSTMLARSEGVGLDLDTALADGRLTIQAIDPMELSPGKFAHLVQTAVADGVTLVIIDSLSGYMTSMGDGMHLTLQIRNLLSFLAEQNVTTIMSSALPGLLNAAESQDDTISFIADNVILLRYYEHLGEVRRAISIFKRRAGRDERTIRDVEITGSGLVIGPPLKNLRGVLGGAPSHFPERDT